MRIHVASRWNKIREGFWFIPSVLILFFFLLGNFMVELDGHAQAWSTAHLGYIFRGNPEWAKSMLTTMAATMGAAVALIISVTIVTLTLASQQFGPRLLRNFLRDSTTKFIMGMFFATGAFDFAVRFRMGENFIPYFSMLVFGILGVVDTFLLILFVHHISSSIHVSRVMARVSRDFSDAVEKLFPKKLLQAAPSSEDFSCERDVPPSFAKEARPILSKESGYLQAIDYEYLLELARKNDLILRIHPRPGEFIVAGTPLASVWPASRDSGALDRHVNDAIFLGFERTLTQDVEFAINQLVEMAVRALSPAINDPFTATRCLNRLGQGLIELTRIQWPSPYLYDSDKRLRLIIKTITFPKMVNTAFNLIRQNGIQSPLVMVTLLETIGIIVPFVQSDEDRAVLRLHADMVDRGCQRSIPEEVDRDYLRAAYQAVLKRF
ncbi:MAG: DUF2254 domain-containing protein [Deltaproteobacteria bacterium]|nr:DUF2254 domain-containing protein [Deltaproteobacteria bacterium]